MRQRQPAPSWREPEPAAIAFSGGGEKLCSPLRTEGSRLILWAAHGLASRNALALTGRGRGDGRSAWPARSWRLGGREPSP
mmetsp:Transcript_29812/g.53959  ORF Transcript_29812/g.53959 Transcript_29812/m.53959 type:complete len:81 (+) Transcript_29812:994-1236(+)